MAYRLGIELADRIAAIAPVGAVLFHERNWSEPTDLTDGLQLG